MKLPVPNDIVHDLLIDNGDLLEDEPGIVKSANRLAKPRADGDRDDLVISLPAKYEVCSRCRGKGVHDHPAFANGFTRDEWADEDFISAYTSGAYDVTCEQCHGNRLEVVYKPERMNQDEQAVYGYLLRRERARYEIRRDMEAERRVGA